MKRTRRHLTNLAAMTAALGTLAACGGGSDSAPGVASDCEPKYTFPTKSEGTLKVAAPNAPPFNIHADQTGIDRDFLAKFAEDACLEAEWNLVPAASAIESVASGRADVAAGGWYANEERGKVVNQTDASYLGLPTIFSKTGAKSVEDIQGMTIGTVTGYAWNQELPGVFGSDNVKEYQNADETLSDLATGRLDAAILGSVDAPYLVKIKDELRGVDANVMEPHERITTSQRPSTANYPHTKGNDDLTAALNEAVAEAHATGEFGRILEKYGVDPKLADIGTYS